VGVADAFPLLALPDSAQCEAESACALVSLKGESVVTQKPSSYARRVEIDRTQVSVLPPPGRIFLDARDETLDPRWRSTAWLERMTTQARAIACHECVTCRGVELDVLAQWFFGRACRAAENAGCSDCGEENTVERSVALR
jgi:hypothetical protein